MVTPSPLQLKCQNCHLPLVINDSLLNLSAAQQKLLTSDKSFSSKNQKTEKESPNNNDIDLGGPLALQLPDDESNREKLELLSEAIRQSENYNPLLSHNVVLPREDVLENQHPEQLDKSAKQLDLENLENKLLERLSTLEVNLDDLDDEKLMTIINDISASDNVFGNDDGENDFMASLASNFNENLNINDGFSNTNNIISNRINSLTKIFNILSFKYDIEFPICVDCSDTLLKELQKQYDESMAEKNSYLQFLNKLNKQSSPDLTKLDTSLAELQKLQERYNDSINEIKSLEREENDLKSEIEDINREISQVNKKEASLLTKKNLYELELTELNDLNNQTLNSLNQKIEIYDKLKNSNVFNDVFNISYDGPFGTINELRLGNLKNCKISWLEINSALGQIILLLSIIIKKLKLNIKGYKLVPMGSYSKIEKYEEAPASTNDENTGNANSTGPERNRQYKKITLECYSSGSSTFERLFTHNSLDQAMIALLNVIKQVEDELKNKYDKSIELPYAINLINNKIGGLNIKLNRKVTDDEWTMACKFLITNVKYILAFSSTKINQAD